MSLTQGRITAKGYWIAAPARLWRSVCQHYRRRAKARRLKQELAMMDARMLADIGVSRAQLCFEVEEWERKPD